MFPITEAAGLFLLFQPFVSVKHSKLMAYLSCFYTALLGPQLNDPLLFLLQLSWLLFGFFIGSKAEGIPQGSSVGSSLNSSFSFGDLTSPGISLRMAMELMPRFVSSGLVYFHTSYF